MPNTVYRVVPQGDHGVSVEMIRPSGARRVIPDLRDAAEAKAWVVQTQRQRRSLSPNFRRDPKHNNFER
jgi:hypothetical protein